MNPKLNIAFNKIGNHLVRPIIVNIMVRLSSIGIVVLDIVLIPRLITFGAYFTIFDAYLVAFSVYFIIVGTNIIYIWCYFLLTNVRCQINYFPGLIFLFLIYLITVIQAKAITLVKEKME